MGLQVDSLKNTLKKEQKKVAFLIALTAVFLYVWIPLMKGSDPVPKPTAAVNSKATARGKATGKRAAKTSPEATKERKVTYPAFLKKPLPAVMLPRNPFLSLPDETPPEPEPVAVEEETNNEDDALRAAEKARSEKMVITSTMLSGRNPSCVVDGLVLVKDSEYNGFKVKKISEFDVVFIGEYGEYRVSIR